MYIARACMVLAFLFGIPWLSHASQDGGEQQIHYRIAGGDLEQALTRFAELSGAQLFYPPSLVRGKTAAPLQGPVSRSGALAGLLSGSGLTALSIGPNTYLLQPAPRRYQPAPRPTHAAETPASPAPGTPVELHAVQVTGSRIPRLSLETAIPMTLITREQIEASGFTTLFDLLRHQPGMTGHHALQVSSEPLSQALTSLLSIAVAQSSSLYGLGPRGTLYLIDGKRSANYALVSSVLGGLTDLGGIPLSMVERVEISRGGASAIYGADAMAGVVNIILKRGQRDPEISVQSGISERGDAQFQQLSASVGLPIGRSELSLNIDVLSQTTLEGVSRRWHTEDRRADGLPDMTTPLGEYQLTGNVIPFPSCLAAGDSHHPTCRLDRQRYRDLVPAIDSQSLHARWRTQLGADSEGYVEVLATDSRTRLDNAPMTLVSTETLADEAGRARTGYISQAFYDVGAISSLSQATLNSASVGFNSLFGAWTLDAYAAHHSSRVANTINGVINLHRYFEIQQSPRRYHFYGRRNDPQVLDSFSPPVHINGKSTVDSAAVYIEGPILASTTGEVRAAIGIEAQRDHLQYTPDPYFLDTLLPTPVTPIDPDGSSQRTAIYAELSFPLPGNMQADAAWRIDRVSPYGSSSSPRLGLTWRPLDRLLVRGSIGNSFRAPSLYETGGAPPNSYADVFASAMVPEQPPFAPCKHVTDGLCILPISSERNPELGPERALSRNLGLVWAAHDNLDLAIDYFNITRRDEIAIADPIAQPGRFAETYVRDEDGLLARSRLLFSNIGWSDVSGVHVDVNWRWPSNRFGVFDLRISGQRTLQAVVADSPGGQPLDQAGHLSSATSALASLQWSKDNWTSSLQLRHFADYRVHAAGQPCPQANIEASRCNNPAINLLALGIRYSGFQNWTLAAHINNLLDRQPRNYTLGQAGYNSSFDDPIGRYYLLRLGYRF